MATLIPKYDQGATGAVNRPFTQKLAETISVKDFGAVGDGSTDDTAAIQAALTASVGKTLLMNNGTYIITNLTIPSNIKWVFDISAILKLKDNTDITSNHQTVSGSTVSNVAIYGLKLDGNKANNPGAGANDWSGVQYATGLRFTNSTEITIDGFEIYNCTAQGLLLMSCARCSVLNGIAHDNATVGFETGWDGSVKCTYLTVDGVTSYDNSSLNNTGYDGFFIEHTQHSAFSNLIAYYSSAVAYLGGGSGFKVINCDYNSFSNLVCNNNQWQGFHLENSTYNTVSAIQACNNGFAAFAGAGYGIYVVGTSLFNTLSGIISKSNFIAGIGVTQYSASNNVFNAPVVSSNPYGAIIKASATSIVGGNFRDNTTSNIEFQLDGANPAPTSCAIIGNNIYGVTSIGVSNQTASTIDGTVFDGNILNIASAYFGSYLNCYIDGNVFTEVGSGGSAPAFQNSWQQEGGIYELLAFNKDSTGNVNIRGDVKTGSAGTVVFTLPTGYRPSLRQDFITGLGGGLNYCYILNTGEVYVGTKGSSIVPLNYSFKVT
jgi:parallel beta-helix repeat protein